MKELVELMIQTATERLKKEQESELSEGTFRLLHLIGQLGVYL